MNRALIGRWNQAVGPTDDIYLLGDFAFADKRGEPITDIFTLLGGRKHLVVGNHDEQNRAVLKLPWESVDYLVELRENGVRAIGCHYPIESWKGAHRGYL